MGRHLRSTRTLLCVLFAASTWSCKVQETPADSLASSRQASTAGSSTGAARYGPYATRLSSLRVSSGVFTNDSLVRAIIDSATKTKGADPWDRKHDRIDSRRLMQGQCGPESTTCVPGPFVTIIPWKNVHKNKTLGVGRVVGKLVTSEPNFPYPKLALYAGTAEVYWWVGPRPGGSDTISVYVPQDWSATKPATWRGVTVMLTEPGNPGFAHTQSSTRFVWNDQDDETWSSCVSNGCCQPKAGIDSTHSGPAPLDSNP